jgi:hypothetical protein
MCEKLTIRLAAAALVRGLSWLDRLLAPLVLVAMVLGVVIGEWEWVAARVFHQPPPFLHTSRRGGGRRRD